MPRHITFPSIVKMENLENTTLNLNKYRNGMKLLAYKLVHEAQQNTQNNFLSFIRKACRFSFNWIGLRFDFYGQSALLISPFGIIVLQKTVLSKMAPMVDAPLRFASPSCAPLKSELSR